MQPPSDTALDLAWRIEHCLRTEITNILAADPAQAPVDLCCSLSELGVDSLGFVRVAETLGRAFGVSLPPEILFEHADLRETIACVAEMASGPGIGQVQSAPVVVARRTAAATGDRDIAIVGVAMRVPGACDVDAFWELVVSGATCWSDFPPDRIPPADREHPSAPFMRGGFVDGAADFDAAFFGISPREALAMDPQQRMLMECAWHAFEQAGANQESLWGSDTAVFVGASSHDYHDVLIRSGAARKSHVGTGISHAILANRISQFFNLTGASEAVDAACASSLVALWRGVEALRRGDAGLALVGGVNLLGSRETFDVFAEAGMLSARGECRPFDDAADGYARGEGVVCVVLKRAATALADGDDILALIKGGAVCHSGRTQSLTAPNPAAQAAVIRAALADAGVEPGSIGYVEAHGTGTRLGDPVEILGLKKALGTDGDAPRAPHCLIGSVKSQIGHLEAAAGLAGVVKAAKAVQQGILPGSPQVRCMNALIDLRDAPFRIHPKSVAWDDGAEGAYPPSTPRRAGVSSFGFGGSNAHMILEQPPDRDARARAASAAASPRLFAMSARCAPDLALVRAAIAAVAARAAPGDEAAEGRWLDDLAYTLQRRTALPWRLAIIAHSRAELLAALGGRAAAPAFSTVAPLQKDDHAPALSDTALHALRMSGGLGAIAQAWVDGASVAWTRLLPAGHAALLPLPGYPFDRQRFWPRPTLPSSGAAARPDTAPALHRAAWVAAPLAPAPGDAHAPLLAWVAGPTGEEVAHLCAAITGRQLTLLRGRARADAPLPALGAFALLDLTALDGRAGRGAARLDALRECLGSALRSGRAFQLLQITCGLRGMRAATATVPASLAPGAGAAEAGLFSSLSAEYPRCHSKTVDFESADVPFVAAHIARELACDDAHPVLAYRGGQRLRREMALLPAPTMAPERRAGGVALITGGAGDIGLQLARDLAARGFSALLLSTRRTPSAELQSAVDSLRDGGTAVEFHQGELIDTAGLAAAVDAFGARNGPITYVFHCAGAVDRKTPRFTQKTLASIARILEPKVEALDALYALFAPQPSLRAFVLFSSISAVAPPLAAGALDYASANHYLDLFAQHCHDHGDRRVRSVQWTRWGGTAMAGLTRQQGELGAPLASADCLEMLARLLADWEADWPAALCVAACNEAAFAQGPTPTSLPAGSAPARHSLEPDADVTARVRSLVARELELPAERLDVTASFEAIGLDSIILAGIVVELETWLGQPVQPQQLIECASIAGIARFVAERLPQATDRAAEFVATVRVEKASTLGPQAGPTAFAAGDSVFKVAVIGMACRFPDAADLGAFWSNLTAGRDCISEVPASRWNSHHLHSAGGAPDKSSSKWGGFLDDIESISPEMFSMSAADARDIDPLIRLFTECSLDAAADGRNGHEGLRGRRVGVFAGARAGRYGERVHHPGKRSVTGLGQNFVSAYVSHLLDLRGPSLVLDCACSSSLAAIHAACQSLRCGDCELALAGGVEVLLDEQPYLFLSAAGALSPDGRCRPFDARANGFVPGEGVGCVLLKSLARALADGDPIYAVIAGSAMNNDGHTLGITTPGVAGQVDVIERALAQAGVPSSSISYVEAHGTGTLVGDPIELQALNRAFAADPPPACGLGSVKSNIGHLLSAAGIASFVKVALALHHRTLPPTLNVEQLNPRFDFGSTPFFPVRESTPWQGEMLRAGISAFGFGKTNVHLIAEQAPIGSVRPAPFKARPPAATRVRAWHAHADGRDLPSLRLSLMAMTDLTVEEESST